MSHNVCCLSTCWLWDIHIFYLPCVYLATWIRPRVWSRLNIDGWTRSRGSGPPTLLCMIINIEAAGEGEEHLTSQSKCQSTPIGSSFSGMAAPAWHAWRAWCWVGRGLKGTCVDVCRAGRGERELSAQLPLLSVFVWQNGIPDLINTSIRCDCINTALITTEAV